jgi:hypothetical protein
MRVCQLCALVVALMGTSQAWANSGLPCQAELAAMGLAGLEVISDVEGLAIRGMGFQGATASGRSWASVAALGAAAGTTNEYHASGKYLAGGHNESEAELEIEIKFGHDGHNGGGWGNNSNGAHSGGWSSKGGHSKGGHGKMGGHSNCSRCGGHKGGGHNGGGHNSKPKSANIKVNVSAGGSSIAFRK